LAFRESFDLRLAATLAPALFLLGAAAGTNGESRFCKPEQTAAVGRTSPFRGEAGRSGIGGKHGPFGVDQLEDLCSTAERHNLTTIARVPDIGSSTILRYLDRGIMGILGPHIATEVDAHQLVRACYFGPLGERSFGANRDTGYNAGIADKAAYYREANEQMLVCALLEDVAVLDNLDAILSVPGIDLYGIGPNDFARVLATPANSTIRKLSRQCRKSHLASDRLGAGCNWT
jgi:2-keto-3-deoxy-L-rhamnonate aldolase RhmA